MEPSARPLINCWKNQSNPFLWINRLEVLELASLDLEYDCGLGRVALFVNANFACHSIEILCSRKGVSHFWALGRTSAFHGVSQDHCRIITERSHGVRCLALITLLVGGDEVLDLVRRNLGGIMSREVMTFHRILPDFYKLIRFPAVAAKQRNI